MTDFEIVLVPPGHERGRPDGATVRRTGWQVKRED
jgi:hypothetical protein